MSSLISGIYAVVQWHNNDAMCYATLSRQSELQIHTISYEGWLLCLDNCMWSSIGYYHWKETLLDVGVFCLFNCSLNSLFVINNCNYDDPMIRKIMEIGPECNYTRYMILNSSECVINYNWYMKDEPLVWFLSKAYQSQQVDDIVCFSWTDKGW